MRIGREKKWRFGFDEESEESEEVEVREEELIKPFMRKDKRQGKIIIAKWKDLALKDEIIIGLGHNNLHYPSQIQFQAIPEIVNAQGRDVLCQARSGMGKTCIYLVSLLQLIEPINGKYIPHCAIIVTSTRQLVHQIYKDLYGLSKSFKNPQLRMGAYFGGTNLKENSKDLKDDERAPHILVCTVGRLRHLLQSKYIQGFQVQFFIIDQCDKILGCQDSRRDIDEILNKVYPKRQLWMFTATLSKSNERECLSRMKENPVVLKLCHQKQLLPNLDHYYVQIPEAHKLQKLIVLLDNIPFAQAIIFVNKIDKAVHLKECLAFNMFNPCTIHSKIHQSDRLSVFDMFRKGSSRIIVATDVLARGANMEKVDVVFNYDFPRAVDNFMHRAARAGRFGKKGKTVNLIKLPDQQCNLLEKDFNIMMKMGEELKITFEELPSIIDTTTF